MLSRGEKHGHLSKFKDATNPCLHSVTMSGAWDLIARTYYWLDGMADNLLDRGNISEPNERAALTAERAHVSTVVSGTTLS